MHNVRHLEKPKVRELGAVEVRRAFGQPFFGRIEELILPGGEPTLRADLGEITETLIGCFPRLRFIGMMSNALSTNRVLEKTKTILDLIKASKKDISFFVQVSLDGKEQTHDHVRGVTGAFTRVMDTIQQLKGLAEVNKNFFLALHCVVQKSNVHGLEKISSISDSLAVPIFYTPPVIYNNYFSNVNKADNVALYR